jgi:hypothetical protein
MNRRIAAKKTQKPGKPGSNLLNKARVIVNGEVVAMITNKRGIFDRGTPRQRRFAPGKLAILKKEDQLELMKRELSEKVTFLSSLFSEKYNPAERLSGKQKMYKSEIEGLTEQEAKKYIDSLAKNFYALS